jgi:ATPase subunit of ABC transporter with duplicated ATPase domains
MKIITNNLEPEEGKIIWSNKVKVGYLDQHAVLSEGLSIYDVLKTAYDSLFEMEATIMDYYNKMCDCTEDEMNQMLEEIGEYQEYLDHHDFYLIDAKINEVAAAFGLKDLGLDTDVTNLSGGQRTRILLAKLLLQKPDILLLDEPTNYLDESHIAWLKSYLMEYENAFILISHDLEFLNDVVNVIYHVEAPKLTRYTGNYEEFKRVYELGSRYPDNALALLSKAFSYAKFDNSEYVTFQHFYKAVMNCQSVYSDVREKEADAFKIEFKDFIEKENVDLNDY